MGKVICQLGAVCTKYCTHKWPHEKTETLGCSIEGCGGSNVPRSWAMIDEFDEEFETHTINPAYCIDFDYFLEHTSPGQVIVTKGTVFEGYGEYSLARNAEEDRKLQIRLAEQEERERKLVADARMNYDFRKQAEYCEYNQELNPSLVKEEDRWRGHNWSDWG